MMTEAMTEAKTEAKTESSQKNKAARAKENPVYTQQDDSELLNSTGTNPPDADPALTSNQTGNEGKADSHLPNAHKTSADKIAKKDDKPDGETG